MSILKTVLVEDNTLSDEFGTGEFENDLELQTRLKLLSNNKLLEDYVYNLKEYPGKIKKVFVKGNSTKSVPRQVLDIKTATFQTNISVWVKTINTSFQEL